MSPPQPTILHDDHETSPLGWEGAHFPLSKLDLENLAGISLRQSTARRSPKDPWDKDWKKDSTREDSFHSTSPIPTSNCNGNGGRSPSANIRIIGKNRKGWTLFKFKESTSDKARRGELSPDLVKEIWGATIPLDSIDCKTVLLDLDMEISKIRARKKQHREIKVAETLMDVLLKNWTYFEHTHGDVKMMEKHVHAKYCESEFSHFLLEGDQHVHGQLYVRLHFLIPELRLLLTNLRSQILPTHYQELPVWNSPRLEELPELKVLPMPPMPKLYPIDGLAPVPSEQDEYIPSDLEAPTFKSPIPKEHPPLILPEPVQVPSLTLPEMTTLVEDESTIDYEAYKEDEMPSFVFPHQDPLPLWEEPVLAELPKEPEYSVPEIIPPPILEPIPSFKLPLMDPRPCERSYYELKKDEKGVCDGLCSKHGRNHHFVPGRQRREPCFGKPPPLLPLPPPPFPGAESVNLSIEDIQQLLGETHIQPLFAPGIPVMAEPSFVAPIEEALPIFIAPVLEEEPPYIPLASPRIPSWKEPKPPYPLGWLCGQRPIFLIDCGAAMRGERMEAVHKCLQQMFSPGGQVYIGATHFDIIMYSFDAWSYGDIENSFIYKQTTTSRYVKPLEPMRVKTAESLESALGWASRWNPTGASNLWKALTLATTRTFADCIYLFNEGKTDKPVLILEFLKQAQSQGGHLVPIHTVGLCTSSPKSRFLKRISAVSGGSFIEYDYKQKEIPQEASSDEEMEDILWAKAMVEMEQQKRAEAGKRVDIKEIMGRVKSQYEPVRICPRLQAYRDKREEHERLYHSQVEAIRNENTQRLLLANELHERLVAETSERNHKNLEEAKDKWRNEVEKIRDNNRFLLESFLKWKHDMGEIGKQNEICVNESKRRFALDLNEVDVKNALIMEEENKKHLSEVNRIKKKNHDAQKEVEMQQKEINEKIAYINRIRKEEYEAAVKATKESNAAHLRETRRLYEENLALVKSQNAKVVQEAEEKFAKCCEEVRTENARKKAALAQRLEDIQRSRDEAIAVHQLNVAKAITDHTQRVKEINALNLENEERARSIWKKMTDEIDHDNREAFEKAKKANEDEQMRVQEVNVKLAEKRLALKRRIADVVRSNEEIVRRKKVEWMKRCEEVEKAYQKETAKTKENHKRQVEEVKLRNAEKLQASLLNHKAKVAVVEAYNETVRPYVESSNVVRAEICRIEAFLKCIADCILPPNRHALDKNPTQCPFQSDLDLLAMSEKTLSPKMLIEALRSAYGKTMRAEKRGSKRTSKRRSTTFSSPEVVYPSALIPVHPPRAVSHDCLGRNQ